MPNHRTAGALWALTARASIRDRGLSRKELAVTGRKVTVSGCGCGDVAVMRRNFYWSGETWARALTVPLRTRLLCTSPGLLLPHSRLLFLASCSSRLKTSGRCNYCRAQPLQTKTNSCWKGGNLGIERRFVALGRGSVWLAVRRARRPTSSSKSSVLRPVALAAPRLEVAEG